MKKIYCLLTCIGFCALLNVSPSLAGNKPGAITTTISGAYYYFAPSRRIKNTVIPNIALAYNMDKHWAIEANMGIINTDQKPSLGERGVHGLLYSIDGIYRFTPHNRFEPYVIAGIGMLGLTPNPNNVQHQGNINAGLGAQYFFGENVALRGELRDVYGTTGTAENDVMINFGVSFLFGGKSGTSASQDESSLGVGSSFPQMS
jgi:OOP family OmpA-OmpF porin